MSDNRIAIDVVLATTIRSNVALQHMAMEVELSRRNIPFHKYGGLKFIETAHVKDPLASTDAMPTDVTTAHIRDKLKSMWT